MSIDAASATPDAQVVITLEQVVDHGFDSALTGVRWADGTVECRARLLDPGGSLVACAGDVGIVLTGRDDEATGLICASDINTGLWILRRTDQ